MSEYKTSLVTVNLLNNGEHISNIKNVENVRTTCPFRLKEGWGQKSLSQVSVSGMTTTSIDTRLATTPHGGNQAVEIRRFGKAGHDDDRIKI